MPQGITTDEDMIEAMRFRANTEQTERNLNDENRVQEIAEFIMATAEEFQNDQLASQMREIGNKLVMMKSELAKTPGQSVEGPPPEAPPMQPDLATQQALLAQQGAAQQPGIPPV